MTKPVLIHQSSDSTALMDKLAKSMGQTGVFEVNQNQRSHDSVTGVYGYPIVTAGMAPTNWEISQPPHMLLTSTGYVPRTSPDAAQIKDASRALQFALMRVVEWCLATGADEFKERKSLDYNSSLMREGLWLIENVCDLQPWEISVNDGSAFEELLGQVAFHETKERVSLVDGINLIVDLEGLDYDHDGLMSEAKDLGTNAAISEGKLYAPSAKILPAIANYYGQEPDVKLIG